MDIDFSKHHYIAADACQRNYLSLFLFLQTITSQLLMLKDVFLFVPVPVPVPSRLHCAAADAQSCALACLCSGEYQTFLLCSFNAQSCEDNECISSVRVSRSLPRTHSALSPFFIKLLYCRQRVVFKCAFI